MKAGHATLLAAEKTAQERAMKDAIAKKEAAWRDQKESLTKAIQTLKFNLKAVKSARDQARASTKESDLQKVIVRLLSSQIGVDKDLEARFFVPWQIEANTDLSSFFVAFMTETRGGCASTGEGPQLKDEEDAGGIKDEAGQAASDARPAGGIARVQILNPHDCPSPRPGDSEGSAGI